MDPHNLHRSAGSGHHRGGAHRRRRRNSRRLDPSDRSSGRGGRRRIGLYRRCSAGAVSGARPRSPGAGVSFPTAPGGRGALRAGGSRLCGRPSATRCFSQRQSVCRDHQLPARAPVPSRCAGRASAGSSTCRRCTRRKLDGPYRWGRRRHSRSVYPSDRGGRRARRRTLAFIGAVRLARGGLAFSPCRAMGVWR